MAHHSAHRYRLLYRIGVGGTSEVFRAVHVDQDGRGDRPVVVKRVLPQLARDSRFRRLFEEEARLAATLSHPNVVRVLDYGDMGDTCFIALEQVDGDDLGSLLARARASQQRGLPPEIAAMIVADVADALQFIHHHTGPEGVPLKIIHRDVSPQNILVSRQGEVKLTDFGIAKSAIRREHTVDGALRGKIDYMAPEQTTPHAKVDHRADIFALGCVLYEVLTGTPPFRGTTEFETMERLRNARMILPLAEINAPSPLLEILSHTLDPRVENRYADAATVASALRAFVARCPTRPTRHRLAAWVEALSRATPAVEDNAASAVDEAVRALLGDAETDHPHDAGQSAPCLTDVDPISTSNRQPTSQFAVPAQVSWAPPSYPSQADATLTLRPHRHSIPSWALALAIALLAAIGGSMWAITAVTSDSRHNPTPAPLTRGLAPNSRGTMKIVSSPQTTVYVDGQAIGTTPLLHRVAAGQHRVVLKDAAGRVKVRFAPTVQAETTEAFSFQFE